MDSKTPTLTFRFPEPPIDGTKVHSWEQPGKDRERTRRRCPERKVLLLFAVNICTLRRRYVVEEWMIDVSNLLFLLLILDSSTTLTINSISHGGQQAEVHRKRGRLKNNNRQLRQLQCRTWNRRHLMPVRSTCQCHGGPLSTSLLFARSAITHSLLFEFVDPSYPKSFQEICELIASGKPIPGTGEHQFDRS